MRLGGLAVLVLLAGGLGYGLWSTRERAAKETVPSEALLGGRRLFDATRLIVQRAPDVRALHFAHESAIDPFLLVEPVQDLASAAFLEQVRGVLDTAQRFLDAPIADISAQRLQEMGLAEPRARIEVRYPDKAFVIEIGLEGPLHQDLYVKMDGHAYRTGIAVYSVLQANVDDVRERLLFQGALDDVRRLVLRRRSAADAAGARKDEVIELERLGMFDFRLLQPVRTAADPNAARALLSFLGGMAADQFLGELNAMPEWDVQIEMEGARGTQRVTVWHTPQGLIGRQEPRGVEFTIKSADYSRTFDVPVQDLRAKVLVPIAMQDIGRVEIDPGQGRGERIQLRRSLADDVRMFQPIECDTDAGAVNELLQATQKLVAAEFVDADASGLAAFGLDRDFLTVSLHPQVRETDATVLHFGRDEGDFTFVKRGDETFVVKVAKTAVDVFRREWVEYVTRKTAVAVPVDASEIRYLRDGKEIVGIRRDAAGKWSRADNGTDVRSLATELLELLAGLRGRRVLDAEAAPVAQELRAATRVDIEVGVAGSGALRTLVVYDRGRDASGRRPAWVVATQTPRVLVELGVTDTGALLAPLSP